VKICVHAKYKHEPIEAGGNKLQLRQTKDGGTYISEYELEDSLLKLEDDVGNILYNTFKGSVIGYRLEKADGTSERGNLNGNKKSMQENHTDFITNNDLTGSVNWMDDLYKTDGTKLL
jgi:hypothetical protein